MVDFWGHVPPVCGCITTVHLCCCLRSRLSLSLSLHPALHPALACAWICVLNAFVLLLLLLDRSTQGLRQRRALPTTASSRLRSLRLKELP